MPDSHEIYRSETGETPFALSHFFHVLRAYGPIIRLSLFAVFIAYIIIALAVYLIAPSQRVAKLNFRLDFEGAERGTYPNGSKFSTAEIVSTPVLLKVYEQNDLRRFTKFDKFAGSVVVLESNEAKDALIRDYQGRLSDPKLLPIDRDRIQREYESKLASLSKNEYAILYFDKRRTTNLPKVVVEKVLYDVLKEWANMAAREEHVLEYRVALLSPDVVSTSAVDENNPIVTTEVLRSRIQRVIANIDEIRTLPSADLVRSTKDKLSLLDVRIRLDDIVRFRLEPLTHMVAASGIDDRPDTIKFLETQLAFDQRQLDAQTRVAEAARNAMAMYMSGQTGDETAAGLPEMPTRPSRPVAPVETVMPQLSDSFIERLIQLTSSSTDHEYRQRLAERYRESAVAVVPLQRAVTYDRSVLDLVRNAGGGSRMTKESVDRQIQLTRNEARQLVATVHEIYRKISENLNPSTELMTVTASPKHRIDRSIGEKKLIFVGIIVLALAFPIIVMLCLLHNRVREEEVAEQLVTGTQAAESAI